MERKIDNHVFSGLQIDLDPNVHKSEFLVDAHNIRFTSRGENTLLDITNEKGTKETNTNIKGSYLGHCVLDKYVTVFTKDVVSDIDYITRINMSVNMDNAYESVILYKGNLNFSTENPISTLGSYETENIQKVYWVDGRNQPRVINITKDILLKVSVDNLDYNDDSFNFVNELALKEKVHVQRMIASTGVFPAGCIQYAITYYNKYGQESNIAAITPIFYTTFIDRAGSPEEIIGNSFKVIIENPDLNFDYVRLYSIFRSSENGQPIVKRVGDLNLKNNSTLSYINTDRLSKVCWTPHYNSIKVESSDGNINVSSLPIVDIRSLNNVPADYNTEYYELDMTGISSVSFIDKNTKSTISNISDLGKIYISTQRISDTNKYIIIGRNKDNTDTIEIKTIDNYLGNSFLPSDINFILECCDIVNSNTGSNLQTSNGSELPNNFPVTSVNQWIKLDGSFPIDFISSTGVRCNISLDIIKSMDMYITTRPEYKLIETDNKVKITPAYYIIGCVKDSAEFTPKNIQYTIVDTEALSEEAFSINELTQIKVYDSPFSQDTINLSDLPHTSEKLDTTKATSGGEGGMWNAYRASLLRGKVLKRGNQFYTVKPKSANDFILISDYPFNYAKALATKRGIQNIFISNHCFIPINRNKIDGVADNRSVVISKSILSINGVTQSSPKTEYTIEPVPIWKSDNKIPVKVKYRGNEFFLSEFERYIFQGNSQYTIYKEEGILTTDEKHINDKCKVVQDVKGYYVYANGLDFSVILSIDNIVYEYKLYSFDSHVCFFIPEGSIYLASENKPSAVTLEDKYQNPPYTDNRNWIFTAIRNNDGSYTYERDGKELDIIHKGTYVEDYNSQSSDNAVSTKSNESDTTYTFIDNNTQGEIIDPTALLYIGGESIIASTIEDKDGTLFLGNITLSRPNPGDVLMDNNMRLVDYLRQVSADEKTNNGDIFIGQSLDVREFAEPYILDNITSDDENSTKEVRIIVDPAGDWEYIGTEDNCDSQKGISKILVGRKHLALNNKATHLKWASFTIQEKTANGEWKDASVTFKNQRRFQVPNTGNFINVGNRIITGYRHTGNSGNGIIITTYEMYIGEYQVIIDHSKYYYTINKRPYRFEGKVAEYLNVQDNSNRDKIPREGYYDKHNLKGANFGKVTSNSFISNIGTEGGERNGYFLYKEGTIKKAVKSRGKNLLKYQRYNTNYLREVQSEDIVSSKVFKNGETYRLGLQFQYKTGKWSDPVYVCDYTVNIGSNITNKILESPSIIGEIKLGNLLDAGYKRVRPVIVEPTFLNRKVIAQGFLCPTIYYMADRDNNTMGAMSSWFTRVVPKNFDVDKSTIGEPFQGYYSEFREGQKLPPAFMYNGEISTGNIIPQKDNKPLLENEKDLTKWLPDNYSTIDESYIVDSKIVTFNSPDLEFDTNLASLDWSSYKFRIVGKVQISSSAGDIDIVTSSPNISTRSAGFIHKTTMDPNGGKSLLSDYMYDSEVVVLNTSTKSYEATSTNESIKFLVNPWQHSGSLNNDTQRNDGGVRSAVLQRKVLSNIKVSNRIEWSDKPLDISIKSSGIKLFNSDQIKYTRLHDYSYYGNVDTAFLPSSPYNWVGMYQGAENDKLVKANIKGLKSFFDDSDIEGTESKTDDIHLRELKEMARIKYKSTPHIILDLDKSIYYNGGTYGTPEIKDYDYVLLGELYKDVTDESELYPIPTNSNLMRHSWIVAGDSIEIAPNNNNYKDNEVVNSDGNIEITNNNKEYSEVSDKTTVRWRYGDTYYQRYDCLKTYPFTQEDENSIVDILSFMCETRVNLDGRYDKNRGLSSNLYITPQNFNLHNPVYNQVDNYFQYKILDSDYYNLNYFNTEVLWSTQKFPSQEVDPWTTITLASLLDLNGQSGDLIKVIKWSSNLYAFQKYAISIINFNSKVQIPVSEGTPIEITNNYKVDGTTSISESLGCSNPRCIVYSPSGVYFIDTKSKELYLLNNNQCSPLSISNNMSSWFKNNDVTNLFYDSIYGDLYIRTNDSVLVYSEPLQVFTSFMDYQRAISLFSVFNQFIAFTPNDNSTKLWEMFNGDYHCNLFGEDVTYGLSFISNSKTSLDKTFTNLSVYSDWFSSSSAQDEKKHKSPIFFDTIEVSNEFQYGIDTLSTKGLLPNLQKKFRNWGVLIPRDDDGNRIRNPWSKITLSKTFVPEKISTGGGNYYLKYQDEEMKFHSLDVIYYE